MSDYTLTQELEYLELRLGSTTNLSPTEPRGVSPANLPRAGWSCPRPTSICLDSCQEGWLSIFHATISFY